MPKLVTRRERGINRLPSLGKEGIPPSTNEGILFRVVISQNCYPIIYTYLYPIQKCNQNPKSHLLDYQREGASPRGAIHKDGGLYPNHVNLA